MLLFTIAVSIFSLSMYGQRLNESQVPGPAKTAFEKSYPGIRGSWDKEDANYEVNFRKDGKPMSAVIDKNGTIVETEADIPAAQLPKNVRDYVKQHYSAAGISEAAKVVKASGEINFEAEVNHKDLIFDANGKFIKEEKD